MNISENTQEAFNTIIIKAVEFGASKDVLKLIDSGVQKHIVSLISEICDNHFPYEANDPWKRKKHAFYQECCKVIDSGLWNEFHVISLSKKAGKRTYVINMAYNGSYFTNPLSVQMIKNILCTSPDQVRDIYFDGVRISEEKFLTENA